MKSADGSKCLSLGGQVCCTSVHQCRGCDDERIRRHDDSIPGVMMITIIADHPCHDAER